MTNVYGHYANRIVAEGRRVLVKNYRTMRKHFSQFSIESADSMNKIAQQWRNLAESLEVKISKLSDEKKTEISLALRKELKLPLIMS